MQAAQQRQAHFANQHRRDVQYKVGDRVLLSTRNLALKGGVSSRKLLPRYIGPFTVTALVGSAENKVAVRLDLPHTMRRLHPVFHVSLLKPYLAGNKIPHLPPPPVDWLEDEPLYTVEALLQHRDRKYGRGKRREYLVKWAGYGVEHNTWEPRSNLLTCEDLLHAYHEADGSVPPAPLHVEAIDDDDYDYYYDD
jgi:hypothetical protein